MIHKERKGCSKLWCLGDNGANIVYSDVFYGVAHDWLMADIFRSVNLQKENV